MNCIMQHDIVRSLRGHDSGKIFLVIQVQGANALLVDGKTRKLQTPKLKSVKHLELVQRSNHQLADSIGSRTISNKEIIRLLAVIRHNAN